MSPWATIKLVASREVAARRKAAGLVTLLTVVVIVAGLSIAAFAAGSRAEPAALAQEDADQLVGFIGTVLLFVAIIFTGQVILLGVAEEKNSRVVEVVLGTVRARHLLGGKILAIGLLGVFEILVAATTVLVVGSALDTVEIPAATGGAAVAVLMWFVLGFWFYSTVFAAAGAMVGRTENAANAALPINLALMVGYFVALSSIDNPDNVALRVASLLPPIAPLTMPMRMINGSVAPWEVVVAAALTAAAGYGLVRAAGRVYLGGVLATARTGWRRAFKAAEPGRR